MSNFILDASTVLVVLQEEDGAEDALEYFAGASISTVNMAEVLTKLIEKGRDPIKALEVFELLQLNVIEFDQEHAKKAAELRTTTKHLGLSLGDRSCLALAIMSESTAVTADRQWKKVKLCPVEVIRK
jgi:PIN domain nuclease of toxin-antitoxin system